MSRREGAPVLMGLCEWRTHLGMRCPHAANYWRGKHAVCGKHRKRKPTKRRKTAEPKRAECPPMRRKLIADARRLLGPGPVATPEALPEVQPPPGPTLRPAQRRHVYLRSIAEGWALETEGSLDRGLAQLPAPSSWPGSSVEPEHYETSGMWYEYDYRDPHGNLRAEWKLTNLRDSCRFSLAQRRKMCEPVET